MELTKHGHACVVLSEGDRRIVVDPGMFTDPAAMDGASALLITHEHADHFAPDRVPERGGPPVGAALRRQVHGGLQHHGEVVGTPAPPDDARRGSPPPDGGGRHPTRRTGPRCRMRSWS